MFYFGLQFPSPHKQLSFPKKKKEQRKQVYNTFASLTPSTHHKDVPEEDEREHIEVDSAEELTESEEEEPIPEPMSKKKGAGPSKRQPAKKLKVEAAQPETKPKRKRGQAKEPPELFSQVRRLISPLQIGRAHV